MDDIFEVLIYILFIAASVVGGIYKNYAKKKEEERRQRRLQDANNSQSEETPYESQTEKKTIPSSLEDFLKQQFEIETELVTEEDTHQEIEYTGAEEPIVTNADQGEGVAAFKKTSDTLISDNLNDTDFSISSEINKQFNHGQISEEEEKAFSMTEDGENNEKEAEYFDLHQAVVFSEILKRPYQD